MGTLPVLQSRGI